MHRHINLTQVALLSTSLTQLIGNIANCTPEILKIYYKLYREHHNCEPEILVSRYKLPRLAIPYTVARLESSQTIQNDISNDY